MSLARPLWSAGIARSPLEWHIRQSARPSSVCGIAIAVGVGAGAGAGLGAGLGAGVGAGAGAVPPHAESNGTRTSIAIKTNHIYFFMSCFTSVLKL